MSTSTTACIVILGCVAIASLELYRKNLRRRSPSYPLPPGPPGLPWLGNVIGIDVSAPWLTYSMWAKTHGDIIYSRLMGKDVIIINSEKVAKELLEGRSRNYSDRPYLITNELCGVDYNTSLLPYGDLWRLHRRFFHRTFRSDAIPRFHHLQFRKSCRLLQQLLSAPNQLSGHVFDYTASLIMNSIYDCDPVSREDDLIQMVTKVLAVILSATQLEVALIVGAFPPLLYLPSWLPGMSFKRRMAAAKALASEYVERPFEHSLQRLLNVGPAPSMVHDSFQGNGRADEVIREAGMKELKAAAATAFVGGSETMDSVIMVFFLMMVLNPEAQEKAQVEIDRVLSGERLPTIADRASLPYVDAILREVYRYNPVVPLSVPHAVIEDDVYSGYHIPKGALVITNLWSMAHNESKYPNADKFIPERFLTNNGSILPNDTEHLAFGFGRRICPGRHFADTAVWSAIATVLAVFSISKPRDANGVEIPVEPKFSSGVSTHPLPFPFSIVPRKPGMDAEKLEKLIAATTLTY